MKQDNFQLIYIAGYGRSGSTILDIVLSSHPNIFGVGEINLLFESWLQNGPCSCGKSLDGCEFWNAVLEETFLQITDMDIEKAAKITRQSESFFGSQAKIAEYNHLWTLMFKSIMNRSKCEVIVDSSKTSRTSYRRPLNLMKIYNGNFHLIHLVRGIDNILQSVKHGSNRKLEKGVKQSVLFGSVLRGVLGWVTANQSVEWTRRCLPDFHIELLRYEDFIDDPVSKVAQIINLTGLQPNPVLEHIKKHNRFDPGHGVAGNRMRRNGPIALRPSKRQKGRLPLSIRLLSYLIRPIMRRY